MQGIYNYRPDPNYVSSVCNIAAVLYLQFVLQVMLFRSWNMFCTFALAIDTTLWSHYGPRVTQPLTEMSTRNISWGVKAAGA